jgi:hypothetical protein
VTTPARAIPTLAKPYTIDLAITRILQIAGSQVGYREGRNNDNIYGTWYGLNNVAWCAQFVSWCANQAGYLNVAIPAHQYTPTGWNWFKARDRDVITPKRGDIFYVYGYMSDVDGYRVHHVGFVEKVLPGGYIQTLEGNTNDTGSSQGNGVYRGKRLISTTKLRFARPDYSKVLETPETIEGDDRWRNSKGQLCLSYRGLQHAGAGSPGGISGTWAASRYSAMITLRYLGFAYDDWNDDRFPDAWGRFEVAIRRSVPNSIPDQWSFPWFCSNYGFYPPDLNDWP